jgi:hypothetical protein
MPKKIALWTAKQAIRLAVALGLITGALWVTGTLFSILPLHYPWRDRGGLTE